MTLRNRGEPAGFSTVMAPLMARAIRRANRDDLDALRHVLEASRADPGADTQLGETHLRSSIEEV